MKQPRIDKLIGAGEDRYPRRKLLRQMAGISLGLSLAHVKELPLLSQATQQHQPSPPHTSPATPPAPTALSQEDDQFLNELEHANFLFFWEQANPQTGLIKDRCNVRVKDTSIAASIASTGFGLTAICIGEKRGFISHADGALAGHADFVVSVAQAAHASRILLSLREYQYRRTDVGLGGFLGRYGDSACAAC